MKYKVTVTEVVPAVPSTQTNAGSPETDGAVVFSTTVGFLPSLTKLVAALTPPRIRKPRSQKAS